MVSAYPACDLKLHASKQIACAVVIRPSVVQPLRSRPPAPACPEVPVRRRIYQVTELVVVAAMLSMLWPAPAHAQHAHAHHAVVVHGGYGYGGPYLLLPRFLLFRVRVVRLPVGPMGPVGTVAGIRVLRPDQLRAHPRAAPRGRGVRGRLLRRQCRRFRRHVPAAARAAWRARGRDLPRGLSRGESEHLVPTERRLQDQHHTREARGRRAERPTPEAVTERSCAERAGVPAEPSRCGS